MSSHPDKPQISKGRGLVLVTMIYGLVNALCVLVPFIPGPATLLLWGLLFPVIGIIGTWVNVAKEREENSKWWAPGVGFSLLYVLMGFLTVRFIVEAWASV